MISLPERLILIQRREDGQCEMYVWPSVDGRYPGDQCKVFIMDGVSNLIQPIEPVEREGYFIMLDPDPNPLFSPAVPCPDPQPTKGRPR
jgi:hypothetical protein